MYRLGFAEKKEKGRTMVLVGQKGKKHSAGILEREGGKKEKRGGNDPQFL